MTALAPSPDLIARFRADLETLAGTPSRLGVAVSGGPDSLALLLLAAAAFPGRVAAATVDHGLRPESGWEALHVEDICGRLACPHSILSVRVPQGRGGPQADARSARYGALIAWAQDAHIPLLATAHLWLADPLPPAGATTSRHSRPGRLFDTHVPLDDRVEALREL